MRCELAMWAFEYGLQGLNEMCALLFDELKKVYGGASFACELCVDLGMFW